MSIAVVTYLTRTELLHEVYCFRTSASLCRANCFRVRPVELSQVSLFETRGCHDWLGLRCSYDTGQRRNPNPNPRKLIRFRSGLNWAGLLW